MGQLSILLLLTLILKYLFLDSTETPFETSSYHPRVNSDTRRTTPRHVPQESEDDPLNVSGESADWFNVLIQQVLCSRFYGVLCK
jgi:maintenance of mitochondrial morphology protein 1